MKEMKLVGVARRVGQGDRIKIMVHRDQLQQMVDYMAEDGQKSENFMFLLLDRRKEPSKWTHFMKIDTWKPDHSVPRKPKYEPEEVAHVDAGFEEDGF